MCDALCALPYPRTLIHFSGITSYGSCTPADGDALLAKLGTVADTC
jgi:hypothetical protein